MNDTAGGSHPDDELAAYAVGGLAPDDDNAVATHLAHCTRCRAELDAYLETLAALTNSEEPPPQIWDRINAQITAEPRPRTLRRPRAAGPFRPMAGPAARPRHPGSPRRRRVVRARAAAALGAAALVVTVVAVGITQLRSDPAPDTVDELAQAAIDDPDSTVVGLDDPDDGTPAARLVIDASGDAYVLLDNLTRLPDDQTYQLWRTETTTPVSLGVLGTGATDAVRITLPAGTARLAISQEPTGGSPAPTGPLVAAGTRT
jgi:anti-sigma-K factor RskA